MMINQWIQSYTCFQRKITDITGKQNPDITQEFSLYNWGLSAWSHGLRSIQPGPYAEEQNVHGSGLDLGMKRPMHVLASAKKRHDAEQC